MATKPVLFLVDDEPTTLAAIARDVEREYGADYHIVTATSGTEALELLRQLKLRNEVVVHYFTSNRIHGSDFPPFSPCMTGPKLRSSLRSCAFLAAGKECSWSLRGYDCR